MPKQPIEGEDYVVTLWDKFNNYQCTKCQYASIFWNLYLQHYLTGNKHKHVWAFPVEKDPNDTSPTGDVTEVIY